MQITTIGLDIAKNVFQVHGIDAAEKVVVRRQLRRGQVIKFFAALAPCLVGMEACATAHYWARELTRLGHEVRLMPAKDVKAYVKRNKNDAADAGRAAGSADAASHARSSAAATHPGDQCATGAFG
jgi:transposase